MDLGLHSQRVAVLGSGLLAKRCRAMLAAEGAIPGDDDLPACFAVIAIAPPVPHRPLALIDDEAAFAAWDHVTDIAVRFRRASEGMAKRGGGRIVWIGPIEARQRGAASGDLDGLVGLGALGLLRAMAGELGPDAITCNSILWDGRDIESTAATALFLASKTSSYVSGTALTIDGGSGEGLF